MSIATILLIVLVLLLIGALPAWPYSTGWGYYPSGGLGLVLIVMLLLAVTGRAAASRDSVNSPAPEGLSKLDFMVIASMADSPHLLTMASYRAQKNPCAST